MKKVILLSNGHDFKTSLECHIRKKYQDLSKVWIENNVRIIRSSNYEYDEKKNSFARWEYFDGVKWIDIKDITADLVWYKSNITNYITTIIEKNNTFINPTDYIDFANDKYITSLFFKEESPKTYILNQASIENIVHLPENIILKPNWWSWGRGILKIKKSQLIEYNPSDYSNYIIQEALDLSTWIDWVVEWIHDIRFMVLWNKTMDYVLIRTPPKNDFRCNITAGGLWEYKKTSDLPQDMLDFINPIIKKIFWRFGSLFGSIDISKAGWKYYIIEFNSSPWINTFRFNSKLENIYFQKTIELFKNFKM